MKQNFFIVTILSLVLAPMLVGCFNAFMEQMFLRMKRSRSFKWLKVVASVVACPLVLFVTISSLILAPMLVGCYNAIFARRDHFKKRCIVGQYDLGSLSNPACVITKSNAPKRAIRLYVSLFSVGYELAIIQSHVYVENRGIDKHKNFSFLGPLVYC